MGEGLGVGQLVERLVSQRLAPRRGRPGPEPWRACQRPIGGEWCSVVAMLFRRVRAREGGIGAGPMSSSRRLLIRQRAHWPGWGWLGSLQVGQSRQVAGAGSRHRAGRPGCRRRSRSRPQAEHAADRRWQAGHQGWPVVREVPHGVVARRSSSSAPGAWGSRAQRPVRGAPFDPTAAAAVDAGLQVRRVGDEAVGADRPTLFVAGDRLTARAAARALLDAGVCDAGRQPASRPAACRCGRPGGSQGRSAGRFRRHRRRRAARSAAGSRAAARGARHRSASAGGTPAPRPVSAGTRPGRAPVHCRGNGLPSTSGSSSASISWITVTGSRLSSRGTCRSAAAPRGRGGDPSDVPAASARFAARTADRAVPVGRGVAACAGVCRTRRTWRPKSPLRQPCAARSAGPRPREGPASGRHRAPLAGRQGLGQAAALGPAAGHALTTRGSRRGPARLAAPTRSTTTPIGSASTSVARADAVSCRTPGMRARFGRKAPTRPRRRRPSSSCRRCTGGDRFDQLVHRAVQDVQQRHQDLQAQPLGAFHDQPVDLAGGQPDPALAPAVRSGRWWRTCRARPSPAAGATVVEFAAISSPSSAPGGRRRTPGQRLAQRGVHEVAADVGVDRGRGVAAVPNLAS